MNILLISHGSALGGSPISLFNIYKHKRAKDINYHFCFGQSGPIFERVRKFNKNTIIIRHSKLFLGLPMILKFLIYIYKNDIKIVHLNTLTSYYKYPAIASFLLKRKVIWFVRENPIEKRCIKLKLFINLIADKVITVSHDTRKNLYYVKNELITTIYNGVDLKYYNSNEYHKIPEGISLKPYILTISSFETRKGIIDSLKAYSTSNLSKTYNFLIIGEDRSPSKQYFNEMTSVINALNLQDKVHILDPKEDVRPYIANAYFIVLVSYWEGLSRTLLESLSMGKAILASKNGGNKELVFDHHNGKLVNAGDVNQISKNMDRMLDQNLIQKMSKNSRTISVEKFNIIVKTKELEDIYKSFFK